MKNVRYNGNKTPQVNNIFQTLINLLSFPSLVSLCDISVFYVFFNFYTAPYFLNPISVSPLLFFLSLFSLKIPLSFHLFFLALQENFEIFTRLPVWLSACLSVCLPLRSDVRQEGLSRIKSTYTHLTCTKIQILFYRCMFRQNSAIFRKSILQYLKLTTV